MKLTDATIAEMRCPEGKKDAMFFDETLKGFGIRVMPNRADGRPRKVFLIQYRVGDKVRREPLGDWGTELTATQARRKAEALRGCQRRMNSPQMWSLLHNRLRERRDDVFWCVSVLTALAKQDSIAALPRHGPSDGASFS